MTERIIVTFEVKPGRFDYKWENYGQAADNSE